MVKSYIKNKGEKNMNNRKLVLENGAVFEGIGFGSLNEAIAEIIFNTSVVGYQEIISDPTNANKMICMTYPLIGNYGASDDEFGSKDYHVEGFIVKDNDFTASNMRYMDSLDDNVMSGPHTTKKIYANSEEEAEEKEKFEAELKQAHKDKADEIKSAKSLMMTKKQINEAVLQALKLVKLEGFEHRKIVAINQLKYSFRNHFVQL